MAILTLEQARAVLSIKDADPARDLLITEFCEAVDAVVEWYVDNWVEQRILKFTVPASGVIRTNVLEVISGVDASGADVDVSGVRVSPQGLVSGGPRGVWQMTAEVGFERVPPAILRGASEILLQAWATQRGGESAPAFLVPYRAAAWLAPLVSGGGFA